MRLSSDSHYSFPHQVRTLYLSSCYPIAPSKTIIFSGERLILNCVFFNLTLLDKIQYQWPTFTILELRERHYWDEVAQLIRAKNLRKLALDPRLIISRTATPAMAESLEVLHLNNMSDVNPFGFKNSLEPHIQYFPNLKEIHIFPSTNSQDISPSTQTAMRSVYPENVALTFH